MVKWNENNWSPQQGLSLLGVLVALFILTSTVLVIGQLLARSEHVARASKDTLIAANLAREGLELVHAYRDNNWLAEPPLHWTADVCSDASGDTHQFTVEVDAAATRGIVIDANSSPAASRLYITPDGQWTHQAGGDSTQSPYSRLMQVDCTYQNLTATDAEPARVTVKAMVTWESEGKPHQVLIQEELYNWLPTT